MHYSNQNLAGILSEALGLEAGSGRTDFSGSYRETLRSALEDSSGPETFGQLLDALERLGASAHTLDAVRSMAGSRKDVSLQDFARDYARGG